MSTVEIPTHDEIEKGAHVNLGALLMTEEYLRMANMNYYLEHKDEIQAGQVTVGTTAECSECHQMKMVHYMYGGKHPLCRQCFVDVTD
jgi:hypothetical protein